MKTFKSFINEASIAQDYVAPKDSDDEVKDIKPRSKGEDDFKKSHKMTHTKHPVAGDHQFDGSIKEIKEDVEDITEEERDKCAHLKAIYDKNKEDVADGEMASNDPDLARSRERYKKCREQNESVEVEEASIKGNNVAWDDLQAITKSKKSGRVKFNNHKMETVDADTAKLIVTTLNKLNPKNKEKAIATLNKDPAGLMKVLDIVNKA